MPIHIHPVAELAPRVLLPGDPGRAMAMAQTLLADDRLMFNHNRGLWGYSGTAADGQALTIQSTGLGGPSAAIVLEELAQLGAKTAIRVGSCTAISADLRLGDLIAADAVIAADSRGLGALTRVRLDRTLCTALQRGADHLGPIASHDHFYDPAMGAKVEAWRNEGAIAFEMQTAALAAVAARHEIAFGCVLMVSDLYPPASTIGADERDTATGRLGAVAAEALLK